MIKFNSVIVEYKAKFTRFSMIVASASSLFISLFGDNFPFNSLSILLLASSLIFALCAVFYSEPRNYKYSAYILISTSLYLITYTIYLFKIPIFAGAFTFMPMIIAAATFLLGAKVGAAVLVYCFCLIFITHHPSYDIPSGIQFDDTIWIDRSISSFITFTVAATSEYTMRLALEHIEGQRLEIQVNEKLTSLGVFVGGIAHEINNPLAVMIGAFKIIKKHIASIPDGHELEKWVSKVDKSADRISNIITSLLFFTSESDSDSIRENFWATSAVNGAFDLLVSKIDDANISHKVEVSPYVLIKGNEFHLSSIIRILTENAADSLIEFRVHHPKIEITDSISSDLYEIKVVDNGVGIPQEIQSKILDPFFTTKEVGKGSGMGLALAFSICNVLGWKLSFESRKGFTAFCITIKHFELDQQYYRQAT